MTEAEIKTFIDTNFFANGVNSITGEITNSALTMILEYARDNSGANGLFMLEHKEPDMQYTYTPYADPVSAYAASVTGDKVIWHSSFYANTSMGQLVVPEGVTTNGLGNTFFYEAPDSTVAMGAGGTTVKDIYIQNLTIFRIGGTLGHGNSGCIEINGGNNNCYLDGSTFISSSGDAILCSGTGDKTYNAKTILLDATARGIYVQGGLIENHTHLGFGVGNGFGVHNLLGKCINVTSTTQTSVTSIYTRTTVNCYGESTGDGTGINTTGGFVDGGECVNTIGKSSTGLKPFICESQNDHVNCYAQTFSTSTSSNAVFSSVGTARLINFTAKATTGRAAQLTGGNVRISGGNYLSAGNVAIVSNGLGASDIIEIEGATITGSHAANSVITLGGVNTATANITNNTINQTLAGGHISFADSITPGNILSVKLRNEYKGPGSSAILTGISQQITNTQDAQGNIKI